MDIFAILSNNEARLSALYGDIEYKARYTAVYERFMELFGSEPEAFVSAPGRTEVVGNHTDHNHGRVLAAAVNLDVIAAIKPRGDMRVTLYSEGYAEPFTLDLNELDVIDAESETTYSLIRGVAAKLKALGYAIGGFDAYVTSTVKKGSGLSSSAAFEVMIVSVFDALYNGWTIDAKLKARISQYAENKYFGKPSGLMDQMASAVGGLVSIDFGFEDAIIEAIPYDFNKRGYAVCVVAAGGDHGNLTSDYAAMPIEMKQVAKALGREVLAEVTPEQLFNAVPKLKGNVPDRAILRAFHFVDETRLTVKACEALKRDDIKAFFECVIASGESSWKLLQNIYVPGGDNQEMTLALELSRRMLAGRGAWRIHGGGFAGTILAFVPLDMLDEYSRSMNAVFGENATTPLSIRPEGAVMLK